MFFHLFTAEEMRSREVSRLFPYLFGAFVVACLNFIHLEDTCIFVFSRDYVLSSQFFVLILFAHFDVLVIGRSSRL